MLIIISLYQIAIGVTSLILFARTVLNSYSNMTSGHIFLASLVTVFIGYYLYTNFCVLFRKEFSRRHLQFNIWINFIQIVQLALLNLSFKIVLGMELAPYFLYNEKLVFGIRFDVFNIKLNLSYNNSQHDLGIGINVIPLIIFLLLNRQFYKQRKSHVLA